MAADFGNLSFADFVEAVQPMASANRLPQIGRSNEVLIYQVYFNGPGAKDLSATAGEHEFNDVTLHRITDAFGLDSSNFRDNARVAEILAVRNAWMTSVLEHSSKNVNLSDKVIRDYEDLAANSHPWIGEQIALQKLRTKGLAQAIQAAEERLGDHVIDKGVPDAVSHGPVVSQTADYTVQEVASGVVVAHSNDRLPSLPAVGDVVTITYYRGQGQVLGQLKAAEITGPYLDPETQDLALNFRDANKNEHIILFQGAAAFKQFVESEGLAPALVGQAVDLLAHRPVQAVPPLPQRTAFSEVYIDERTGALALDYRERGVPYTALFSSARDVKARSAEFGLGEGAIQQAEVLEKESKAHGASFAANLRESYDVAQKEAQKRFKAVALARGNGGRYAGEVVAETDFHIVQDNGRGEGVVHNKLNLDKVAKVGSKVTVLYADGRGRVADRGNSKSKSQER